MVACGCEVALVGGDAEAVYLAVGMGDGSRANAAEGFPKAVDEVRVKSVGILRVF